MGKCIYTFSGTGTALTIAQTIADLSGNTSIKLIPNALKQSKGSSIIIKESIVGFVFPNYFGGVPNVVLKMIRNARIDRASYIFCIVTASGGQGYSLKKFENELSKKGKRLNYGKYVTGVSNYVASWYYRYLVLSEEKKASILQSLDEQVVTFAKDIREEKNEVMKNSVLSYVTSLLLSSKKMIQDTTAYDHQFSACERCIGCGICKQVCQFDNIEIVDKRPIFKHNCQRCMACFNYCPKNALFFNGDEIKEPRYHHPQFPAKKMIQYINTHKTDVATRIAGH